MVTKNIFVNKIIEEENLNISDNIINKLEKLDINDKYLYEKYKTNNLLTFNFDITKSFKIYNPLNIEQYYKCINISTKLPVFNKPNIPLELKKGIKIINVGPTSILPILITCIKENININSYNFITERGNLNKIMQKNELWKIGVQKIKNVIYLRRYIDRKNINLQDIGYQFENICINDDRINNRSETFKISEGEINKYKILISAEVDCISKDSKWLELKTSTKKSWNNKQKQLNMWIQSYLVGIQSIIVGFKKPLTQNDNISIINNLKEYKTNDLLVKIEEKDKSFKLLLKVLEFLEDNIKENKIYILKRGNYIKEEQIRYIELYEVDEKYEFVNEKLIEDIKYNY